MNNYELTNTTRAVRSGPKVSNRISRPRVVGELNHDRARTGVEFLDMVKEHLRVQTDSALARVLGTSPPYISKVRSGRLPVQAAVIIRVHEETGLSIRDLKRYLERQE